MKGYIYIMFRVNCYNNLSKNERAHARTHAHTHTKKKAFPCMRHRCS